MNDSTADRLQTPEPPTEINMSTVDPYTNEQLAEMECDRLRAQLATVEAQLQAEKQKSMEFRVNVSTAFMGLSPKLEKMSVPDAIQWLRAQLHQRTEECEHLSELLGAAVEDYGNEHTALDTLRASLRTLRDEKAKQFATAIEQNVPDLLRELLNRLASLIDAAGDT